MQVHVGAVEKRVAFGQNGDRSARFEMFLDLVGQIPRRSRRSPPGSPWNPCRFRSSPDRSAAIRSTSRGNARRRCRAHCRCCRAWRNARRRRPRPARARPSASAVPGRPDPVPTPISRPFCVHIQRPGLASALTAAAVMALPPMRPRTMAIGDAEAAFGQRFLRFGRADEADRHADDRRRLRRAVSQAFRADRTARSARCRWRPPRRPAGRPRARARRPSACCRFPWRFQRFAGRAACRSPRCFAGRRARVTPRATISASQRIGAPASSAAACRRDEILRENKVLRRLDQAAGMDHAHRDIGLFLRKPRQVGLRANDREGAFVDRIAVVDVVVSRHFHALSESFRQRGKPNSFNGLRRRFACAPLRSRPAAATPARPRFALSLRIGERLVPRRSVHDKPRARFRRRPGQARPRRDGRSPWRSRRRAGATSRRASRCIRWRFRPRAVAPGYGRTRIPARRGRPRSPVADRRGGDEAERFGLFPQRLAPAPASGKSRPASASAQAGCPRRQASAAVSANAFSSFGSRCGRRAGRRRARGGCRARSMIPTAIPIDSASSGLRSRRICSMLQSVEGA